MQNSNLGTGSGNNTSNNPPSRIVYLGSIPYDQTEQQILDLCNNVGPVTNLKMMFDPTTGKSKGYAFIEFKDLESSASAIRNLNGYQLGSRFLKCGYSTNNDISNMNTTSTVSGGNMQKNDTVTNLRFSNLPPGIDVNINMTTPAMMISSELSKISKPQQLDFLQNFQAWSKENNDLAKDLLSEYPQLSYVIAELLLTNGICKVDDLTKLATAASNVESQNEPQMNRNPDLQLKQKELLRQVLNLNDSEISVLPNNEKMTLYDLKQRAMKGDFGLL
ncbi:hypothetical protein KAFR_0F03150 [Kazachstania africana CBS 2517]|uniref:RRM domain-containing protein n=1 Tax=Kazachstania africana (strain ATCC 22294 / BCRC 22015 / CBS 2517 / CECT 1963 / NBRC 1671 / NRRL Y-8276) TaxID=1071382 RepID=H2AX11_KAZAF|nr:hypothetical protein KAFR_0F03150 [Kazachstania africana CBS 2517]CCF58911.1 hypothetical protein KAFR_0F03150 [Kazachstania africana CBS 2517]